jgi:hypothetical protein
MFESGGNRTGTDFSFIDGNMKPRASYHHMEFFAKYFKGNYAKATSTDNNLLVFGNKTDNQVSVIIMNRGYGYPKEYTLHLNDTATSGAVVKIKVDAGKPASYSDMIGERTTHVLIFRGDSIITQVPILINKLHQQYLPLKLPHNYQLRQQDSKQLLIPTTKQV